MHHHSEHLISFQILFLLGRPLSPWVKKIIQGNIETAAPFVDEVGGFGIFPKDLSSASPRYSYHLYLNQTAPGPGPTFEMVESEILDPGNVECYDRGDRAGFVFPMCKILGTQLQTLSLRGVPPLIQARS